MTKISNFVLSPPAFKYTFLTFEVVDEKEIFQ